MARYTLMVLLLSLFVGANSTYGQTKKSLQDKKKKLQNEIKTTEKKLKETQDQQKSSIHIIEKINKNIEDRNELIRTYESEIRELDSEIQANRREVEKLSNSIDRLKQNYSTMVVQSWLNKSSINSFIFMLASENFNDAMRRARYFRQLGDRRKDHFTMIRDVKHRKEEAVFQLEQNKAARMATLTEQAAEANKLQAVRKEKERLLGQLKKDEKSLLANIDKKRKETDELTRKINAIVEASTKSTTKTTTSKTTTSKTNTNTSSKGTTDISRNSAGGTLTSSFESNKGKLPWPVENGFISGKYGIQPHPVLERIEIKNDGIDITTDKGASVRSVFKGEVTGVFTVSGYENVVIVRHGDYTTVYSNLATVSVSKGATLETKQKIGTVATDEDGKTCLNFQLRKGSATQNPASWLAK